jgi:hypothetical protein
VEVKRCTRCREEYPATPEFFHRDKNRIDGLTPACATCRRKHTNAEVHRDVALRSKYGLSFVEYEARLARQGGVCLICQRAETEHARRSGGVKRLAVDHDHRTGEIRGLLCASCNRGVEAFRDDAARCLRAADYLLGVLPEGKAPILDPDTAA